MTSTRYNEEEFWAAFDLDLRNARGRVLIQSAFVSPWRLKQLSKNLHELTQQGITVCAFVQEPFLINPSKSGLKKLEEEMSLDEYNYCIRLLQNMGVHVNIRQRTHQKFAVIDDQILYEGSLNILSHNRTQENMLRTDSAKDTGKAIKKNRLDECQICTKNMEAYSCNISTEGLARFGQLLERRRKSLGFTQRELAERCSLGQKQIANAEKGRNVTVSSLLSITGELGLRFVFVPQKFAPVVANMLQKQCEAVDASATNALGNASEICAGKDKVRLP